MNSRRRVNSTVRLLSNISMLVRGITLVLVAVVAMFSCRAQRTQPEPASARRAAETASVNVFSEIFRDFEFLGAKPLTYKYDSSSRQSYPLADSDSFGQLQNPQPFPEALHAGQRYLLRNATVKGDLFYRELKLRFRRQQLETSVFMPHSVMAVVYDPPIPVRFLDKPALVLQPMSLLFHGNGYEGLLIMDEASQVSNKRQLPQTNVHDYSLIILKAPN
jgi:hypothetical protein